jgi:hypothetical protein
MNLNVLWGHSLGEYVCDHSTPSDDPFFISSKGIFGTELGEHKTIAPIKQGNSRWDGESVSE